MSKPFLSLRESQRFAGLSTHTVLKLAATGEVRTEARPGHSLRFSRDDLSRFIREKRTA